VKEALLAIAQQHPDVLVSDIGMPEEDGYSLIQQLRQREAKAGKQLPAVALTAYATESARQQALAAGFQMHLSKPVEPDDLAGAVAKLASAQWQG
jgi:CheY-like chemotaxis protein